VALSWSGGKDSALALWALRRELGLEPRALITTVTGDHARVSMHGVRRELLARQAESAGVALVEVTIPAGCDNATYERSMAAALDSPLLRDLRTKRGDVSAKLADYSARFGSKYPDTVSATRQLADIDSQIDAETRRVLSDLEGQATVARQRTNAIAGSLNSARGSLASSSRASVGLDQLQREADSTRSLYEGLLNRYKEISSEAGIEQSDARLVSRAAVPGYPSSPNIPINLALAFIAAIGAAVIAVAIAELLDTSFGTGEEIERRLGMAHLGSIPDLTSMGTTEQPHIYITTRPLSAFAESFRSLRTALLQGWRARPPKTVAIASALPGEGKTIAAVCLAKSAAQAGDKVAVIDCDLRRRRLSTSLGIRPTVGLLEVLAGKAELDAALVYDSATGVAILPLTNEAVTPEDVFGSEAMRNLLDDLGARFDLVVLDTAPILALAETRTLVAQVDAIVLLARWRRTPQKAVEHAIRLLRGAEDRIAGVMLSQVNMGQQRRQGYGDPAYYSGAYEKYYMG
jgi:capsular exopolysaccharide synthesis family protein